MLQRTRGCLVACPLFPEPSAARHSPLAAACRPRTTTIPLPARLLNDVPHAALATRAFFLYPYPMSAFGKPRQLETEAELYDAAIKILMRRAHSVSEMKKALARRCKDENRLKSVVERLKRENLIDDARYAKQFVRFRTETRKQGQFRIARELRARGVPDRHIEAALKEAAEDANPAALIRQRIERKLRLTRGEIDERKLASLYRSLLGAGFPADLIRKEIRRITHEEEVPEVDVEAE